MRLSLVEGETYPVTVVLRNALGALPLDPVADTVTLLLKTQDGRPIDTTGRVTILRPDPGADPPITAGSVRYRPEAGDLRAEGGPYLARWKVTTASGHVLFVPSDLEDRWDVGKP